MEKNIVGQLKEMEKLTVTQKDYEAMEKSVALLTKEREDLRTKVEAGDKSSTDLEVYKQKDFRASPRKFVKCQLPNLYK